MSEPAFDSDNPPDMPAALDEWLRARLDHRLTVVLLAPPRTGADGGADGGVTAAAEAALAAAIAPLAEARLRVERCPDPADLAIIERTLLHAEGLYPDVLLVEQAAADDAFPRAVLRVADRLGILDRAFVALIGAEVTRQSARGRGFEDGYPVDMPAGGLLATLAREAVARDELRRHGSSPPCYL